MIPANVRSRLKGDASTSYMGLLTEQREFLHGMLLQHSTVTFRGTSDTEVRVPKKIVGIIQPYDVRVLTVLVPTLLWGPEKNYILSTVSIFHFQYIYNNTPITKSQA